MLNLIEFKTCISSNKLFFLEVQQGLYSFIGSVSLQEETTNWDFSSHMLPKRNFDMGIHLLFAQNVLLYLFGFFSIFINKFIFITFQ
jgi:hypothetical protein